LHLSDVERSVISEELLKFFFWEPSGVCVVCAPFFHFVLYIFIFFPFLGLVAYQ